MSSQSKEEIIFLRFKKLDFHKTKERDDSMEINFRELFGLLVDVLTFVQLVFMAWNYFYKKNNRHKVGAKVLVIFLFIIKK